MLTEILVISNTEIRKFQHMHSYFTNWKITSIIIIIYRLSNRNIFFLKLYKLPMIGKQSELQLHFPLNIQALETA